MKTLFLATVAMFAFAAPAQAVVLLSDSFDAETPATPQPNLTNFTVRPGGTIDVVASNTFSIDCFGGNGNCLDLDGSPGVGTIDTRSPFTVAPGLRYVISFRASGSQRSGPDFSATDSFRAGVVFNGDEIELGTATLANDDPFGLFSFTFAPTTAGSFRAFVGGLGAGDNVGVVVDNFTLSAVPEPATWAMMILGFGLIGAAMRRARPRVNVSFA